MRLDNCDTRSNRANHRMPHGGAYAITAFMALFWMLRSTAAFAEEVTDNSDSSIQMFGSELLNLLHRGGPAMWVLAAIFLIGTFYGIGQLFFLTRRNHTPPDFEKDVVHLADTKGMDAGIALCREHPSSLARVLQAALIRHGAPLAQLEVAVRSESNLAGYVMLRRTRLLRNLAILAPVIGVFGFSSNLIRHMDWEHSQDVERVWQTMLGGFSGGLYCLSFSLIVTIALLCFYFVARGNALDLTHDIEVKTLDSVVTLDRKGRQSIRLIEDIEEKIKTESMIKVPDLSAEFDEHPHAQESAIKTAVTTHAGGAVKPESDRNH